MQSDDSADGMAARERIATLILDPSKSRQLLPGVLNLFESDDPQDRISAASGVCLAAAAEPSLLSYLLERLVDRLHAEEPRAEAMFAFEYLTTQFPARSDEALQQIREERDIEPLAYNRTGGFRRSNIYSSSLDRSGVGRTEIAGQNTAPGPRRVYEDDETTDEAEQDADESSAGKDEQTDEQTNDAGRGRPDWGIEADALSTIVSESAFEDITILAGRERGRFADVYRTLAIAGGSERAVGLRLFRRPDADSQAFSKYLSVSLDKWNRVSATDHVVSLYDRGKRPRPWAAVAYTEQTLADRGQFPIGRALWNGVMLARGVATLHENGVVHGGIDPRSIAYTGNVIDDSERQAPLIDHVGLVEAFRFHFDPSECLDPRYAAPEYYDRKFGEIDHSTDIYQLGTTLYRLFTGVAPFDGDARRIKKQVLEGSSVPPSERRQKLPSAVDEVVSKAMAPQKLTRYETAAQVEQDLLRLRDTLRSDGD